MLRSYAWLMTSRFVWMRISFLSELFCDCQRSFEWQKVVCTFLLLLLCFLWNRTEIENSLFSQTKQDSFLLHFEMNSNKRWTLTASWNLKWWSIGVSLLCFFVETTVHIWFKASERRYRAMVMKIKIERMCRNGFSVKI